ncbi:soluble guanylate cyclase 89Db-like isoform X2 [Daphnia pulicaria]|uniref:soluble guanylate cyclase 89Db-like isoform X2 n=1 Tax=Daphnia pulicaria TaxID=35523 RepID=UPI001EEB5726|nr:soluble guanylate cyclase 89Db-like isoform X2 [Daphnia pulicaria]
MYGMLLESVQHFIQLEYGEETWLAILESVGYRNTVFRTHHIYPDELIMKLADAAVTLVANGSTRQDFLRFFGRCFVRYFSHYGYEKFIKVCGRYFCDFLTGIDNIHLQMRYMYPKMVSPSMYISHEDAEGVLLHYRTTRNGFCPYLIGQLHQIAHDFYGIQLTVEELTKTPFNKEEGYQFRFRLNFDNRDYMTGRSACNGSLELGRINISSRGSAGTMASEKALASLSSSILMQLFPFTLVFRPDLQIIAVGRQLKQMFPDNALVGQALPDVARVRRPKLLFTWDNLYSLQKVLCEMELLPAIRTAKKNARHLAASKADSNAVANKEAKEENRRLMLQGQLRYLSDWNAMIFLCNPLINNLEDMDGMGLTINDLSLHGHGRDMVMAGWQHNSRLEDMYERAEERSQQLQQTYELQDEWKKRGDKLLYSMIPQSVADTLRSGTDPVDTCQAFESITVLFVELANIDEITATNPMEAVSCMNAVFSCFDNIIDQHNVYKVETVGKVYMVVGGAPETNETHVKDVAMVALSFRDEIDKMVKDTKMSVHIRIGFHTGSAVAGVVGKKMPRYCFFGDTINTAARMQTTSLPGKIHISQNSFCRLHNFNGFVFEMRGTVFVKVQGTDTYTSLRFLDESWFSVLLFSILQLVPHV